MTYYEILEVSQTASEEVIQMAYKALVKKYHPDVFQGNSKETEEKMKQINIAYSVLSDVEKRAQYDVEMNSKENAQKRQQNNVSRKKGKWLYIVITILLFVSVTSCLILFEPTKNIEQIKDSVVMIEVQNDNRDTIATGSGFCAYKNNWIVTNFHVIEGARNIVIVTDERETFTVKDIVFFNKKEDLAILQIDGELNPLSLGASDRIKTQDRITTIGSPKGELNTVSEGIISNVDNKKQIRISAPISHGSSGGVLLNQNNEVIGITSAGYDDAQNLNFAINISVLDGLYADFQNDDVIMINDDNLSKHIGNLNDFEEYMSSSSKCYSISSLNTFFELTDINKRFEYLLEKKDYDWYSIYTSLNENDRKQVVDLFLELNSCIFDNKNIEDEIDEWNITDFFINLNVLNKYEYAITCVDINNYNDKNLMFDNVDNNYPLEAAEKSLILYLIGGYEWHEIHIDNKEDIFDYFDVKYGTRDFGAILELLGYDVVYENDGTLTAYW